MDWVPAYCLCPGMVTPLPGRRLGSPPFPPVCPQVMYLDSDSMPLLDPTPFFELESYRFNGSLFWPDHWCHKVRIYEIIGHDPWQGGDKKTWWQTETGQFLFDRCAAPALRLVCAGV